jgi:hypothetical protein
MSKAAGTSLVRRVGAVVVASASALALLAPSAAQAAPTSVTPPTISGTLDAGQTLTATPGSWTDSGATITSYWYQWMLCQDECTAIDNANSSTYTITDADNGQQLEVGVIAYDSAENFTSVISSPTFVVGLDYTLGGPSYTLSESTVGNGSVAEFATVPEVGRTADANLTCPGSCGAFDSYPPGTEIELIATPAAGSTFLGWGGACSGSAPTCSLTMSSDEAAVATFSGQAATNPVLPPEQEREAGEAQPPMAGAPILGAWEVPTSSAADLTARLLGIHDVRRHIQAVVRCQEASSCRLSLALFASIHATQTMLARRSFTIAPRRSVRISLALSQAGERLLAERHRLPVTARLTLSVRHRAITLSQGRLMLTE